jgi:hypothetical protein
MSWEALIYYCYYFCYYAAVLGERDDLVMVDLEQQYWPYLWHPAWPPLAIWVHIILTLDEADTGRSSKTHAALLLLACNVFMLAWLLWLQNSLFPFQCCSLA